MAAEYAPELTPGVVVGTIPEVTDDMDLGDFLRQQCGGLNEAFSLLDVDCAGSINQEQFIEGLYRMNFPGDALSVFCEMCAKKGLEVVRLSDFIIFFATRVKISPPSRTATPEGVFFEQMPEIAAMVRNEVKQAMTEMVLSRTEVEVRKALDAASANAYASWESQASARLDTQMKGFAVRFEDRMAANEPQEGTSGAGTGVVVGGVVTAFQDLMDSIEIVGAQVTKLQDKVEGLDQELTGRVVIMEHALIELAQKSNELRGDMQRALDSQRAGMEGALDAQRAAMEVSMEGMQQKITFSDNKLEVFTERVMAGLASMMDSLEMTVTTLETAPPAPAVQTLAGEASPQLAADRTVSTSPREAELQKVQWKFSAALQGLQQNLLSIRPQDPSSGRVLEQGPMQVTRTYTSPQLLNSSADPRLQSRSASPAPDRGGRLDVSPLRQQVQPGVLSSMSGPMQSMRIGAPLQSFVGLQAGSLQVVPGGAMQAVTRQISPVRQVSPLTARQASPLATPRLAQMPITQPSVEMVQPAQSKSMQIKLPNTSSVERLQSPMQMQSLTKSVERLQSPMQMQPLSKSAEQLQSPRQMQQPLTKSVERLQSPMHVQRLSSSVERMPSPVQSRSLQLPLANNTAVERRQSLQKPLDALLSSPAPGQALQRGRPGSSGIEQLQSLHKEQLQALRAEQMHSLQLDRLKPGNLGNLTRIGGNTASNALTPRSLQSAGALSTPSPLQPVFRPVLGGQPKMGSMPDCSILGAQPKVPSMDLAPPPRHSPAWLATGVEIPAQPKVPSMDLAPPPPRQSPAWLATGLEIPWAGGMNADRVNVSFDGETTR